MTTVASAGSTEAQRSRPVQTSDDNADRPRQVSAKTPDYWLTLFGSLIGSLGLVWVLYAQILPFSGVVGFVICWYLVYLAIFAAVTALAHSPVIVRDRLWTAVITGAAGLVGFALATAVVFIAIRGWPAVHHLNFWKPALSDGNLNGSLDQGTIWNAFVGSLFELGVATAVSLPLGIVTAVYMVEVGGKFSRVVRTVVEAMTALPDILAGLFIYALLIVGLGLNRSGFAAAMALSVMMLPIIARSADVQLRVVPSGLREASLALGATQWRTVWKVVLPTQLSGLTTAVILGMARAVGETAPVLITSGFSTYLNPTWAQFRSCFHVGNAGCAPFTQPMNSLPLYIINAVRSPSPHFIQRGFGAGIALLVTVLIFFGLARSAPRLVKAFRWLISMVSPR